LEEVAAKDGRIRLMNKKAQRLGKDSLREEGRVERYRFTIRIGESELCAGRKGWCGEEERVHVFKGNRGLRTGLKATAAHGLGGTLLVPAGRPDRVT